MSTLPEVAPEIKRKTIAELAKESASSTPNLQPQKQKHHESRGAAMNQAFEAEYFKFVGQAVEVKVSHDEVISGLCVAATPYGHLLIRTTTHKIIIKTWHQMKRAAGEQKA